MQPHRSRYWLNSNPEDPEVFRQQAAAVCDTYEQARRLAEQDNASAPQLLALIEDILDDGDRPGTPPTFTPEQVVQIVAVACEPPEKSGRPLSHWTTRELADEVKKRQIVADIHPTTVGLFLKRGGLAAAPQPLLAQQQPGRSGSVPAASGGGLRHL